MKTLLSLACLLALSAFAALAVNADVAKPKPPESKIVLRRTLEVVPDGKVWQARLQLSESDLKELRAALNGMGSDTNIAAGAGSNLSIAASIAQSPTRTIVAGVLLFLSVSFAGVWLARSSSARRGRKAIAAGIVVVAVLSAAAIITRGNAGPPPGYLNWSKLPKNYSQGHATSGEMVIEVVPDEPNRVPGIKLLLPYNSKQNGDE